MSRPHLMAQAIGMCDVGRRHRMQSYRTGVRKDGAGPGRAGDSCPIAVQRLDWPPFRTGAQENIKWRCLVK